MPKLKLTYFDFAASRGEECRLALALAGVEWEDERLARSEWIPRKPTTPYGQLPVLEVEGHGVFGQSNAILALIGRRHGLHPDDLFEAARHEGVMEAVEELRAAFAKTRRDDEAEKKKAREEFAEGWLRDWARNLERQIGDGPFLGGAEPMVADLKLYVAVGFYLKGGADYVAPDTFAVAPKLVRLVEAVEKHPRVRAWYER